MNKHLRRLLTALLAVLVLLQTGAVLAAADGESYTIRIYAGNIGATVNGSSVAVISASYGESVAFDASWVQLPEDSPYYVRGIRLSGRDNNTVSSNVIYVTEDADYVVAYGIKGKLVAYTVSYVDPEGNPLAASQTYYGNAGDKPVVAYLYVDGYLPQAYNLTKTLSENEAENVFVFVYTPIATPSPAPTATPGPTVTPAPSFTPAPGGEAEPTAAPDGEVEPTAAPAGETETEPTPVAGGETEPEQQPEQVPETEPEQQPEQVPETEPEQQPEQIPGPEQQILEPEVPEPEAEQQPEQVPETEPEQQPGPEPETVPEQQPEQVPEQEPEQEPEPEPEQVQPTNEPQEIIDLDEGEAPLGQAPEIENEKTDLQKEREQKQTKFYLSAGLLGAALIAVAATVIVLLKKRGTRP